MFVLLLAVWEMMQHETSALTRGAKIAGWGRPLLWWFTHTSRQNHWVCISCIRRLTHSYSGIFPVLLSERWSYR